MAKKLDKSETIGMENVPASDFDEIEQLMGSSLQPIKPRPEFVNKLYERLTDPMSPTVRLTRRYPARFFLLIFAAVLSGAIFILSASRLIISLIKEIRFSRDL
jgi:hypothetical protein